MRRIVLLHLVARTESTESSRNLQTETTESSDRIQGDLETESNGIRPDAIVVLRTSNRENTLHDGYLLRVEDNPDPAHDIQYHPELYAIRETGGGTGLRPESWDVVERTGIIS